MAVIVILAIIAVIATPIITGIIEDSKKASFERSAEGVVEATKFDITDKLTEEGYTYQFENGNIDLGANVKVSNAKNLSGTIKYNSEGEVNYAIHNNKWCVVKQDNSVITDDYAEGTCVLGTPVSCFQYNVYESGINIVNYKRDNVRCGADVVIPSKIDGKKVVKIDRMAFYENQLTSVEIPESVTSIGDEVFWKNQLISVIIPNSVTSIGKAAFANNQLTNIIISESVTSIGEHVFNGNQLTSVIIPDSVTSIGRYAFCNNQLTSVTIPESVTSIGEHAFYKNQLTSVEIPESVTSIGQWAFSSNQLTNVEIPSSVTSIGQWAFYNNKLTNVTIPSNVTSIENFAFSKKYNSNPNLTKIINKTGKTFNWGNIINESSGYEFITGTIENDYGNVEITSE